MARIVLADDEAHIRDRLREALEAAGHQVRLAQNGTEALHQILVELPDLAVIDMMMPYVDGFEVLQRLRAAPDSRQLPVIILTGHPSLDTATASIQHEVSAYIHKPFTPAEFRDVIARIAKKKGLVLRREDELHAAIGRQIRDLRKARGLTLKQMARRTNLSVSLLSQIERAESSASVSSLFKVATALDVRLTDLFAGY